MAADNKTFYIEKDTNYALQVEYAANINFDDIKRIAKSFVMQLPEAVQNKIYNELEHGEQILDSEPQLNMYLYSFGNMHQAKMQHAFSNIDKDWFDNKEIEIIDYGCGQALATMLYHDYLQANGISQTVSKITLIEPSAKALCRAGLHAKAFYPEAEIHTINKLLNDVAPTDISHSGKPVLHLFSNILDIEVVDLHHLATLAQAENEEIDTLWVCVSPFFGNHKDNRIPCFLDILNQSKTYTFQRSKGTWQNQWTINCIIAEQKSEENLSTEVTDEDIANGIKDEYGVLYSPCGKRLLKGNKASYTVREGTKVICDRAFVHCESLHSIVIPDSVTEIGGGFSWCIFLRSIVIPDSVTKIGNSAFSDCKFLRNIVIPDSVTKIGDYAFSGCSFLQSIVIPDSVTEIGNSAFSGCSFLQSIFIPDSVTEIGDRAFGNCESLHTIFIPDSVTKIGHSAFSSCESLQSIVIPDSVTEIGNQAFRSCSSLQSIVIPDSVTKIGNSAFWGCTSLQSIVIPKSVTEIGDYAFCECESLQSIVIPKGKKEYFENVLEKEYHHLLIEMDEENFSTKVTKKEIANGIKDEYGCIYSPDGKRLLKGNKEITSYTIKEGTEVICDGAFESYSFDKYFLKSIVIPNSVIKIGNNAFGGCSSLQSIVIPDSVTSIGDGAFMYCTSLQSIVIPDSVTKIDDYAFNWCESLQSIVIPDSVTSIGERAFYCCHSLKTIVIPDSVTEVGDSAFAWCGSLQSIVIPKGKKKYFENILEKEYHHLLKEMDEENFSTKVTDEEIANGIKDEYGCIYSPDGKRLLKGNKEITSYTIKEGTEVICDKAFEHSYFLGNYSLKSIVIPESVTKIGDWAFYGCFSLQSIVIPESVTEIGICAFSRCTSLQSIVIPESVTKISNSVFSCCESLQSIVIPDSVTKIGESAFSSCTSLQSIVIPDSVTAIGESAFWGCKSLQSIVIPESVTEIGSSAFSLGIYLTFHSNRFVVENDLLIDLEEKRLIQCLKNKKHTVIPESVTKIGEWAFKGCSSLQSIFIPESVPEIGYSAFRRCSSLQSIVIPNSVTEIGDSAFFECSSLQSIVIPDSVTKIGEWAFYWCRSLQSIVIPDSVTSIGYRAFESCKSLQSIVIPDSVTEIGDSAFGYCSSLQTIVIPEGKKEYFEVLLRGRYYDLLKEMDYKEVYNDSEPIINSVWNMKGIWEKLKSIMLRLRR